MEVLQDDGLYRHLKFTDGGSSVYRFDLHTWLGSLCISGDMGCLVFSRTPDMFSFFRNNKLSINLYYWEEKIQSDPKYRGVKEFSRDRFELVVREYYEDYWTGCSDSEGKKHDLWEEIKEGVLSAENEQEAHNNASCFKSGDFEFTDFWEHDLTEYTFHYHWLCYAIVWGIQQYDRLKTKEKDEQR